MSNYWYIRPHNKVIDMQELLFEFAYILYRLDLCDRYVGPIAVKREFLKLQYEPYVISGTSTSI